MIVTAGGFEFFTCICYVTFPHGQQYLYKENNNETDNRMLLLRTPLYIIIRIINYLIKIYERKNGHFLKVRKLIFGEWID